MGKYAGGVFNPVNWLFREVPVGPMQGVAAPQASTYEARTLLDSAPILSRLIVYGALSLPAALGGAKASDHYIGRGDLVKYGLSNLAADTYHSLVDREFKPKGRTLPVVVLKKDPNYIPENFVDIIQGKEKPIAEITSEAAAIYKAGKGDKKLVAAVPRGAMEYKAGPFKASKGLYFALDRRNVVVFDIPVEDADASKIDMVGLELEKGIMTYVRPEKTPFGKGKYGLELAKRSRAPDDLNIVYVLKDPEPLKPMVGEAGLSPSDRKNYRMRRLVADLTLFRIENAERVRVTREETGDIIRGYVARRIDEIGTHEEARAEQNRIIRAKISREVGEKLRRLLNE